jgi:hypothetical protein
LDITDQRSLIEMREHPEKFALKRILNDQLRRSTPPEAPRVEHPDSVQEGSGAQSPASIGMISTRNASEPRQASKSRAVSLYTFIV